MTFQEENGRHSHSHHHHHHHNHKLTPSQSSESLNVSKEVSRLPAKLNKELEKRKIGSRSENYWYNRTAYQEKTIKFYTFSLTNINIADSIRDKSIHRSRERGGHYRKGSVGGGGDSPEDIGSGGRRKPGHLRDSLAEAAEKYSRYD